MGSLIVKRGYIIVGTAKNVFGKIRESIFHTKWTTKTNLINIGIDSLEYG